MIVRRELLARVVRILEQFVRARMREKNERHRLQIQEFVTTDHAVRERLKHDIPPLALMQISEEDDYPTTTTTKTRTRTRTKMLTMAERMSPKKGNGSDDETVRR